MSTAADALATTVLDLQRRNQNLADALRCAATVLQECSDDCTGTPTEQFFQDQADSLLRIVAANRLPASP